MTTFKLVIYSTELAETEVDLEFATRERAERFAQNWFDELVDAHFEMEDRADMYELLVFRNGVARDETPAMNTYTITEV